MLSWVIGDVTVKRIVEIESLGGSRFILPQATPEAVRAIGWLAPQFADEAGKLKMSIHALLIEAPGRRIIVDTCIGNDKVRDVPAWSGLKTGFLEDLARAGAPRETVDTVLCTHLHVDHVGWNTMKVDDRWVPTFPNARYLIARSEFEHWQTTERDADPERTPFHDSVRPVFEAGLVDLVPLDHIICPEVSLEPTLGHTPGHVSVRIRSKGEEALITGDFTHHPCQLAHPEWASSFDFDPQASTQTRLRVYQEMAASGALMIGTHFAPPTAGRVVRRDGAWMLET